MMHMTFYWGTDATLLFDQWVTSTALLYNLSLVAIFVFAILHEWLFYMRIWLSTKNSAPFRHHHDSESTVPFLEKLPGPKGGWEDFLVVLLYGISAGTAYLLMLLVMSFNGGVFLAVVLGLLVGFGLFRTNTTSEA